MTISLTELLDRFHACGESRDWAESLPTDTTIEQAWQMCEHGDWMLWIAAKLDVDQRLIVLSACGCARLALRHVADGETRPLAAIETAEAWCRGAATIEQVRAAAYAVRAAESAYPARAAAYAARAADAATYTAGAAAYAVRAADAAYPETLARCADIARLHIPWAAVEAAITAIESAKL